MNQEERQQLLEEQASKMLDFPVKEAPDPEMEREQREFQRREDAAVIEAFRQKPKSVGEILRSNVELYRRILDPRVLLEASEIGLGEDELNDMRERMKRWANAVLEKKEGETFHKRRSRLNLLMFEIFGRDRTTGCECEGTGWVFTVGEMGLKGGKVIRNVEHYRTCDCAKGEDKRIAITQMGKPRSVARGRGKKDPGDAVPF